MRTSLLALALAAAASAAAPAAAQSDFRWSGTLAEGKTIAVRGIHGSIRTAGSDDGWIHVDAISSDPASVRVEVTEHEDGVTVCAVYIDSTGRAPADECGRRNRETDVQNSDARVDFVVRVPAGVHFSGSMISGDVAVEGLRADVSATTISGQVTVRPTGFAVRATTISGDVELQLSAGQGAELYVNTVSGEIDSDFPIRRNAGPVPPQGRRGSRGRSMPQIVRATIGGGGPELRVTTISGSISLRQR